MNCDSAHSLSPTAYTSYLRLPRRKATRAPRGVALNHERRTAERRPLDLPVRLRLGNDLFPGQSCNLSVGGLGVLSVCDAGTADGLALALAGHQRGALEVLLGDIRFVVRVRIARVQPADDGLLIGLAIDDGEAAQRLAYRLEACGC